MKDQSAIRPLIDAPVTTHEFKGDHRQRQPGQLVLGLQHDPRSPRRPRHRRRGRCPRRLTRRSRQGADVSNQSVLDALVALTKQNFGFDVCAWHTWFHVQRKSDGVIDTRRD